MVIDICFHSHRIMDLGQIALDMERKPSRVGPKRNTNKTKIFTVVLSCFFVVH